MPTLDGKGNTPTNCYEITYGRKRPTSEGNFRLAFAEAATA